MVKSISHLRFASHFLLRYIPKGHVSDKCSQLPIPQLPCRLPHLPKAVPGDGAVKPRERQQPRSHSPHRTLKVRRKLGTFPELPDHVVLERLLAAGLVLARTAFHDQGIMYVEVLHFRITFNTQLCPKFISDKRKGKEKKSANKYSPLFSTHFCIKTRWWTHWRLFRAWLLRSSCLELDRRSCRRLWKVRDLAACGDLDFTVPTGDFPSLLGVGLLGSRLTIDFSGVLGQVEEPPDSDARIVTLKGEENKSKQINTAIFMTGARKRMFVCKRINLSPRRKTFQGPRFLEGPM